MKIHWMIATLMIACFTSSMARGQGFTERGAALGGIAGALGGAAIGKHNNNTGVGALIGGAVGLATGAAIGSSQDADIHRQQAYHRQQHATVVASRAVSSYDVINMTRGGISDHVIINHIMQNGVQRKLEVNDVIALHQQGVSEPVISALQRAPLAGAAAPVYVAPRPVYVETAPVYIHRPYHPYYGHPHYGRSHPYYGHGYRGHIGVGF